MLDFAGSSETQIPPRYLPETRRQARLDAPKRRRRGPTQPVIVADEAQARGDGGAGAEDTLKWRLRRALELPLELLVVA